LNLFRELSKQELNELNLSGEERDNIVKTCHRNGDAAIRSLHLHMPPTYENIEALTQAVRRRARIMVNPS
jgi:hypothetical protein